MSRASLLGSPVTVLALFLGIVLIRLVNLRADERPGSYDAPGYQARVAEILASPTPPLMLAGEIAEGRRESGHDSTEVAEEDLWWVPERAEAWMQTFYEASYLADDIEQAERFDFTTDDDDRPRPVRVHATAHRQPLPFAFRSAWQGDLYFRRHAARRAFRRQDGVGWFLDEAAPDASVELCDPTQDGEAGSTLYLRCGRQLVATVRMLGEEVVLRQGEQTDVRAWLGGDSVQPDRLVRLRDGDLLHFRTRAGAQSFRLQSEESGVASTVGTTSGGRQRLPPVEDEDAEAIPGFATGMIQSMDAALARLEAANRPDAQALEAVRRADIVLTIAEEEQRALQSALVQAVTTLDVRGPGRADPRRPGVGRAAPVVAAAELMDGLRGDVLAIATYPSPRVYRQLEDQASRWQSDHPEDAEAARWRMGRILRNRERRLTNQNLVGHQIGSVFKPLFGLAMASIDPEVTRLRVPGHAAAMGDPSPLGWFVGDYTDHAHGRDGWVDWDEFLRESCQTYMEHLGVLALALQGYPEVPTDDLARTDTARSQPVRARLGERVFARRPVLDHTLTILVEGGREFPFHAYDKRTRSRPETGRIVGLTSRFDLKGGTTGQIPALAKLSDLFGIATSQAGVDNRSLGLSLADTKDEAPMEALAMSLRELGRRQDTPIGPEVELRRVLPDRVDLRTHTLADVATTYTQLLKGAGTNRWPNVKLAEAFARAISGREVRARLAELRPAEEDEHLFSRRCGAYERHEAGSCACIDGRPKASDGTCGVPALDAPVHLLRSGLEGVVMEAGGTGRHALGHTATKALEALNARFANQATFKVFAKTGSSERPWTMTVLGEEHLVEKRRTRRYQCGSAGTDRATSTCRRALADSQEDNFEVGNFVFGLAGFALEDVDEEDPVAVVVGHMFVSDLGTSAVAMDLTVKTGMIEMAAARLEQSWPESWARWQERRGRGR